MTFRMLHPARTFTLAPSWKLSCDAGPLPATSSTGDWSYAKREDRRANASLYRQISKGSVIGLLAGLAISTFSRPLAVVLGLLVFGIQFAASRGFNVIPYARLQRYVQGIDLRAALEKDVAFKLSLGATCALAAFASL
ncbi:MAG: hypothetical protein M1838_004717 [Thelocarpon superellum]|nr:MAG: hypothetical protein M1838_004717 [Thelocarpon superellum]